MKNNICRVLILPDLHVPNHCTKSLAVVEQLMADYRWDEYVNLGDLMDFDMLSKFNADTARKLEGKRIMADYEIANEILDRHQAIIRKNNKKAKFTLLEGNHDERMERFIDKFPNVEGLLEVEKCLRLQGRGFKWVRSWSKGELHKIGKLYFSHGLYLNKYHAAKMVDNFGCNIVYGHTHDVMSHVKTVRGKDKVINASSLGHLSDELRLAYMRNRPSNWCQAVGIAEIRPDGNFNLTSIEIINHQFSYAGKVYK